MDPLPAELPILRLGLVGFNAAQQALFETALVMLRTRLRWCVTPLAEADALCVNGSRALFLADGSLQVAAAAPGEGPLRMDPSDADRPMAFTVPFAAHQISRAPTFDMASPASTRAVLDKFEGWLRPMAIQFCVASRIVQSRIDLSSTVYHVSVEGRLIAIVSRRSGVGVLPIGDPARVHEALWSRRPELADEMPGHFVQAGLTQVLWQYAIRTRRKLLPGYFRSGPIYWCRAPQLPQRLFSDSHLAIARELAQAPASFAELGRRTGLAEETLARDLAALRIAGAVSHDRKQAAKGSGGPAAKATSMKRAAGMAAGIGAGLRSMRQGSDRTDMTAPAPLTPSSA